MREGYNYGKIQVNKNVNEEKNVFVPIRNRAVESRKL